MATLVVSRSFGPLTGANDRFAAAGAGQYLWVMTRTQAVLVGVGGAVGATVRWALSTVDVGVFPWPTLLVNLAGAAILGALLGPGTLSDDRRALLATGFCGGLTTFSTLSVEVAQLLSTGESGDALTGWVYLAVSVLGGLAVFTAARTAARRGLVSS